MAFLINAFRPGAFRKSPRGGCYFCLPLLVHNVPVASIGTALAEMKDKVNAPAKLMNTNSNLGN
jgi:hypothetical protein